MLETWYEEYEHRQEKLPFVITCNLIRTKDSNTGHVNWHDNPELQWCIEGSGTVLLDGECKDFLPGDITVVNPHVIHHTGTKSRLIYSVLIIDPEFCRQAGIDCDFLAFETRLHSPTMFSLLSELQNVYNNVQDVCRIAKLEQIVLSVLIELRENHTTQIVKTTKESLHIGRVRQAILYIRTNFDRKLLLEEIAAVVNIDKYTLSREFREVTGMTVVQYINNYRCKRAAEYIEDGSTVSEAARLCGFQNMSFFAKTFRSFFHTLPSDRKKRANERSQ